jgi:hypothetical protein
MAKKLAFLLATCDEDSRHFERKLDEFTRLGYPFAVNFDRCCQETKRLFQSHPCYLGGYQQDVPDRPFGEADRQRALDVIVRDGFFDWAAYTDTDELLDLRAAEMIPRMLEWDVDEITCSRVELWGENGEFRRVDGPFTYPGELCRRFYNLRTGVWRYLHADLHAPMFTRFGGGGMRERHCPLTVIHYSMRNMDDVRTHAKRWTECYTRAFGKNKYQGFYDWLTSTEPTVVPFDYQTWRGYE